MIEGTICFIGEFLGSFRQYCVKKKPYLNICLEIVYFLYPDHAIALPKTLKIETDH